MNNPPLYKTVDTLFHAVMDRKWVPKYFKDRPGLSAAVLGTTGTLATLETTKLAAKYITPNFYNSSFDYMEVAGIAFLTGALIHYSDRIGGWAKEHPVYTPGMTLSIITAYVYAFTDLLVK